MDLKQMEYFKTVVDSGNINQAAKLLHMSQPPLSMSMKKLEDELGVSLFIRGNRHVTLTDAGAIFYQRVCRILELTSSTVTEVAKAGMHRTFSLGLTPSTIPVVSDILADFSDTYPDMHFQIYDGSTFELQHLLDKNVIDAAFLRTPFASGDLDMVPIKKEPMVAAIPQTLIEKKSKIIPGEPISLKSLSGFPLSIYRRYQNLITETFNSEGLEPNILSICDDARTSLLWVQNGKGVAIFPKSLVNEFADDIALCPISSNSLETTILFVFKKGTEVVLKDFLNGI